MTEQDFIHEMTRKKSRYYDKAFQKLSSGWISWNWSAGFFSIFWLIFHKMYKEFFLTLLAVFTSGGSLSFFGQHDNHCAVLLGEISGVAITPQKSGVTFLSMLPVFLLPLIFGLFANKLFFRSLQRKNRRGYHLLQEYRRTDTLSLGIIFATPFVVIIASLLCIFF